LGVGGGGGRCLLPRSPQTRPKAQMPAPQPVTRRNPPPPPATPKSNPSTPPPNNPRPPPRAGTVPSTPTGAAWTSWLTKWRANCEGGAPQRRPAPARDAWRSPQSAFSAVDAGAGRRPGSRMYKTPWRVLCARLSVCLSVRLSVWLFAAPPRAACRSNHPPLLSSVARLPVIALIAPNPREEAPATRPATRGGWPRCAAPCAAAALRALQPVIPLNTNCMAGEGGRQRRTARHAAGCCSRRRPAQAS
jgi:hypothetical protein